MASQENIFDALRLVIRDELKPIDEKFTLRFNEVMNSNDKIAKELHDMRVEMTVFNAEQRQQNDRVVEAR